MRVRWFVMLVALAGCESEHDTHDTGAGGDDTENESDAPTETETDSDTDTEPDTDTDTDTEPDTDTDTDTEPDSDTDTDTEPDTDTDTEPDSDTDTEPDTDTDTEPDTDSDTEPRDPFVEDFTSDANLEPSALDATLDTAGSGWLRADPLLTMDEDTGDGRDGIATVGTFPGGTYQFASMKVPASGKLTFTGDSVWRVQGDAYIDLRALVQVEGKLLLVAGGEVRVHCGQFDAWELEIHQPGTQGVIVEGCTEQAGFLAAYEQDPALPGDVRIWTRGGLLMRDRAYLNSSSPDPTGPVGPSGDIEIRAYGDVVLEVGSYLEPLWDSDRHGAGAVSVWTEGDLRVAPVSWLETRKGVPASELELRVGGDLEISGFVGSKSGRTRASVEGLTRLHDEAELFSAGDPGGTSLRLSTGSLVMESGAYIRAGAGSVQLDVTGDAVLDGTVREVSIAHRSSICVDGGLVALHVGGDLSATLADIYGGNGCPGQPGADVEVLVGGTFTEGPDFFPYGGSGSPDGSSTVEDGATLTLSTAPRGPWTFLGGLSKPLPRFGVVDGTTLGAVEGGADVFLAGDGATWTPLESATGLSLQEGWRYRAGVRQRQFDATGVDGFEVR